MPNTIGWTPAIGDPTLIGWFTCCAYLLTAGLCLAAFVRCRQLPNPAGHKHYLSVSCWIWLGIFMAVLFLGINKQLDLQILFTEVGRNLAFKFGWYAERRIYQTVFIVVLMVAVLILMLIFVRMFKSVERAERLALLGAAVVLVFVFLRASSFHHLEVLSYSPHLGTRIREILEISGIGIVFSAALLRCSDTMPRARNMGHAYK